MLETLSSVGKTIFGRRKHLSKQANVSMCAAACTVNMAEAQSNSKAVGVKEGGGKEKWKKDPLGPEGGKGRVRPRFTF